MIATRKISRLPAAGWFQVLASRPETTVEVELRSLD